MAFDPDAYLDKYDDEGGGGDNLPAEAQPTGFDPDAYLAKFDPDEYLKKFDQEPQPERPPAESAIKTFVRKAAHGVIPAAAGFIGAAAGPVILGALTGSGVGPLGTIGGAIAGGLAAGYGASKAQSVVVDEMGWNDDQQMAINAEEHPVASWTGEMAPFAAGMKFDKAASLGLRAGSGAINAAIDTGQQLAGDEPYSLKETAGAFAVGAAMPTANAAGRVLERAGGRLGAKAAGAIEGFRKPGRPDLDAANAAADKADADAANDQTTVAGGTATEQQKTNAGGETEAAGQRSERDYGKDSVKRRPTVLTEGYIDPAVMQAAQTSVDANRIRDRFPAGEEPTAPDIPTEANKAAEQDPAKNEHYTGTQRMDDGLSAVPPQSSAGGLAETAGAVPTPPGAGGALDAAPGATPPPGAAAAIAASKARSGNGEATASVPFMITKATKQKLAVHGFSPDEIRNMTPAQAQEILSTNGNRKAIKAFRDKYAIGQPPAASGPDNPAPTPATNFKVEVKKKRGVSSQLPDEELPPLAGETGPGGMPSKQELYGETPEVREPTADLQLASAPTEMGNEQRSLPTASAPTKEINAQKETKTAGTFNDPSLPKVVTAAVNKAIEGANEHGMLEYEGIKFPAKAFIKRLLELPHDEMTDMASRFVNGTTEKSSRPNRIRGKAATIEGTELTAKSKADAEGKGANLKTHNDAYDKVKAALGDHAIPTTPEEKAAVRGHLQQFLDDAKQAVYVAKQKAKGGKKPWEPASPTTPYLFKRAVKALLAAKNPKDEAWATFMGTARRLAEGDEAGVRAEHRAEADAKFSRRSGDAAVQKAEASRAKDTARDAEDEANTKIDRENVLRDAGWTESEIRNADMAGDVLGEREAKAHQGHMYIAGEYRQPTEQDLASWRQSAAANEEAKRREAGRITERFEEYQAHSNPTLRDFPPLSDILGSDWGAGDRGNGSPEAYRLRAFQALNQKYDLAKRILPKMERQFQRAEEARNAFEPDRETDSPPREVKASEDFDKRTGEIDITKPEGREKLQSATQQLADDLVKAAGRKRKAPEARSEDKLATEHRQIDTKEVDKQALLDALERAKAKAEKSHPGAVREEELGKHSPDHPEPDRLGDELAKAGYLHGNDHEDMVAKFLKDNGGALNIQKIAQDFRSIAMPKLREYAKKFAKEMTNTVGMRLNPRQFRIDNLTRFVISHNQRKLAQIRTLLDGKYEMWVNQPKKTQEDFQDLLEQHQDLAIDVNKFRNDLVNKFGIGKKTAAWMADDAPIWRDLMNDMFIQDRAHGIEENYVRGYVAHLFKDDDVEPVVKFILGRLRPLGARWYQQERVFDSIKAARAAGFELKYPNPIDVLHARVMASVNNHVMIDAMRKYQDWGYAVPQKEASKFQKQHFKEVINLPDGQNWLLAPDAVPFWKNAIEDKGLQGHEGKLGSIYRGMMRLKTVMMPIQLGLSLFHFGHIMSISAADNLDRAFGNWMKGDKFKDVYGEAFRNIGRDSVLALPLHKIKWLEGTRLGNAAKNYEGRQIMHDWNQPNDALQGMNKLLSMMFEEAGTSPHQPMEDVIGAKRDFMDALAAWRKDPKGVGANLKMITPSIRRGIEKSQEWLFKEYVPALKAAALARRMLDAMRHDRSIAANPVKRMAVYQELSRSNDDRYGEMFYKGLFWNKALKDTSILSYVSLGWNLGQGRQVAGAGTQGVRAMTRLLTGTDNRGAIEKARQEASNKISFVSHYVALSMLAAGGLTWALSGKAPDEMLDYVYPKNGETNPDGSAGRLSTPFNTREGVMLKAHIDERNSVVGGVAQLMWNKMILQPFAEVLANKDLFGNRVWDTNASPVTAALQGVDATMGRIFNPISVAGGTRAYDEGGGAKGVALAMGGFGPAPKYASQDAWERRITHVYREQALPEIKPYQYGPKTGLGHGMVQSSIRMAAGDKTEGEARTDYRKLFEHAKQQGNHEDMEKYARLMAEEGHLSPDTIRNQQKTSRAPYEFARLPAATQEAMAAKMDQANFNKYVGKNPDAGIKGDTRKRMNAAARDRGLIAND